MSDRAFQNTPAPRAPISSGWLAAIYGSLLVLGLGAAAVGVINDQTSPLLVGGVTAALAAVGWPIAVLLASLLARHVPPSGAARSAGDAGLVNAIQTMTEQAALSDDARRVLNRRREREHLRKAIEEDIASGDWDAALVLTKELAERFGYRADAEGFRSRIEAARFESVDRSVAEAVARIDTMIAERHWEQAAVEAGRITRLYPESQRTEGLRHRVESARQRYKHGLERRFLDAAENERTDDAMRLLSEMDAYFTDAEAAPYVEVARGVIGKARQNYGVQFKMAVHNRQWDRAVQVGEQILEQFPNSRMAEEIRGVIDDLRSRMPMVQS